MSSRHSRFWGLALALGLAVAAYWLNTLPVPPFTMDGHHPLDAMLIAIILGMVVRNTVGLSSRWMPGVKTAATVVMQIGIVLMGARLNFFDVVRTSAQALAISVVCVAVALSLTIWLCRRVGIGQKLGIMIGIGTAICGGTAIAVCSPVIEGDDNDTAFAITIVTMFGMVAVFLLPVLGHVFGMSQLEFGVWAGTSVHQTPQVIATGFAYGGQAGDIATIVKLVRVLLLAPVVIGLGIWYAREKRRQQVAHVTKRGKLTQLFPPFIAGFVLLALGSTLHLLPNFTLHLQDSFLWSAGDVDVVLAKRVTWLSTFILTVSMGAVGLGVDIRAIAKIGLRALYVGFAAAVILAGFSYGLLKVVL